MSTAIECKKLVFGYDKDLVLNEIDLNVKSGQIFALLGPSGCGKTTLLRCVLGRLKPESGNVFVFGHQPNSRQSNIPGPGVGYMPQELGLPQTFNIFETIRYFGMINNMDQATIRERTKFLVSLLELTDKNQAISDLSGGQQRRVSIAVAFLHQPPLLVLDEPTVGLDSLLRETIWSYLKNLSSRQGVTVVITTHYIEEARSSNSVAFMRGGRILAQQEPNCLMNRLKCSSLEDAFLILCSEDKKNVKQVTFQNRKESVVKVFQRQLSAKNASTNNKIINLKRIRGLIYKDFKLLKNFFVILFILLPVVLIYVAGSSGFGKKPKNLPLTIYNPEGPGELSDDYLSNLDQELFLIQNSDSLEGAIEAVRRGNAWTAVTFGQNYSSALKIRATAPQEVDDEIAGDSTIKLYMDKSGPFLDRFIFWSLLGSFQTFLSQFDNQVSLNVPIDFKAVYGTIKRYDQLMDDVYLYLMTGLTALIIYAISMLMASTWIVNDRQSGMLERLFVSGVQPIELILTHLLVMMVLLFFQVSLLMFGLFVIFDIPLQGTKFNAFALLYLHGFQGITLGLLVSSISTSLITSMLVTWSVTFSLLFISAIILPIESMPLVITQLVRYSPLTSPVEAFRAVVFRGWSLMDSGVAFGFAVGLFYVIASMALTLVLFHFGITDKNLSNLVKSFKKK